LALFIKPLLCPKALCPILVGYFKYDLKLLGSLILFELYCYISEIDLLSSSIVCIVLFS